MSLSLPGFGVIKSLWVTIKHLFQPRFTYQYPEQPKPIPDRFRGRIIYDQKKCIGCSLCIMVCPNSPYVITLKTHRDDKNKIIVDEYAMNFGSCIFCGLCVEHCPTQALLFSKEHNWAVYKKSDLIYNEKRLGLQPDR